MNAQTYSTFSSLCDSIGFKVEEPNSFFFIQVTDIHITSSVTDDRVQNFKTFIEEIKELNQKPKFVVISGDAVDKDSGRNAFV